RGIFGRVQNRDIRLGSAEFAGSATPEEDSLSSRVYLSIDSNIKGHFTISNTYREGFHSVVSSLNEQYELYLLSGDNDSERKHLSKYFKDNKLHFNQQPNDKMSFISSLREKGHHVMMIGDGLNDAGAFMKADVALSIADDVYHFSPAGDAIIKASTFSLLSRFIHFANKSLVIVKLSFFISLCYNVAGLSFALSGNLSPVVAAILMPLSSISVVSFATFSTKVLGRFILGKTK
ncbi:MAG: HAD-IC family P-type ATPase, partial [Bacteroidales bacterium]|nr:HAD-IC family P-type ATPase [Bacteroidales bacterium]